MDEKSPSFYYLQAQIVYQAYTWKANNLKKWSLTGREGIYTIQNYNETKLGIEMEEETINFRKMGPYNGKWIINSSMISTDKN